MKPEIDTYRECVEHLMSANSPKVISNGMPQHAAVLFEVFFKNAKQSVKIFCSCLDPAVFEAPRVIEAAVDAAKRGVALDIIVQNAPRSPNFIKRLGDLDEKESSVLFELLETNDPQIVSMPQNFAVMDNRAYRLERDSKEMKATASMNHPQVSKILVDSSTYSVTRYTKAHQHLLVIWRLLSNPPAEPPHAERSICYRVAVCRGLVFHRTGHWCESGVRGMGSFPRETKVR